MSTEPNSNAAPPWRNAPRTPLLGDGTVHVWRASLRPDEAVVASLLDHLNTEERARAARYVRPPDRDAFIVARAALRCLLGLYAGAAPGAIRFAYTEFGKPYLPVVSDHPPPRFNVSHSGDFALIAVSAQREVGIDIERYRPDIEWESIARRYFAAAEVEGLLALPAERRPEGFFHCWVRKEAYVKAGGRGLGVGLDRFEVPVTPAAPPNVVRPQVTIPDATAWWVTDIPAAPGYAAALVTEGISPVVECYDVDLHLDSLSPPGRGPG